MNASHICIISGGAAERQRIGLAAILNAVAAEELIARTLWRTEQPPATPVMYRGIGFAPTAEPPSYSLRNPARVPRRRAAASVANS